MSFYCGCQTVTRTGVPLSGFGVDVEEGVILPPRPMLCVKLGAEQFLVGGGQHYPNVDIFECSECGRRVVRD